MTISSFLQWLLNVQIFSHNQEKNGRHIKWIVFRFVYLGKCEFLLDTQERCVFT